MMRETLPDGTTVHAGTPWWSEEEHAIVLTDGIPSSEEIAARGLHRPWDAWDAPHMWGDLGIATMRGGTGDGIIPGIDLPVHVDSHVTLGTLIVRARWDVSDESWLDITAVGRSVGEAIGQLLRCETMAVITEPDGSRAAILLTGELATVHATGMPRGYGGAGRLGRQVGDHVPAEDWHAMLGEARQGAAASAARISRIGD